MQRTPRPVWQSLHTATAAAVVLTCLSGCSSRPASTKDTRSDTSLPTTVADAEALMTRLDRDLAAAGVEPAVAASMRERLRGRLLSANVPSSEVDSWVSSADRPNPGS